MGPPPGTPLLDRPGLLKASPFPTCHKGIDAVEALVAVVGYPLVVAKVDQGLAQTQKSARSVTPGVCCNAGRSCCSMLSKVRGMHRPCSTFTRAAWPGASFRPAEAGGLARTTGSMPGPSAGQFHGSARGTAISAAVSNVPPLVARQRLEVARGAPPQAAPGMARLRRTGLNA
jgi:hypothetical protein